jgi:hypothetical protein
MLLDELENTQKRRGRAIGYNSVLLHAWKATVEKRRQPMGCCTVEEGSRHREKRAAVLPSLFFLLTRSLTPFFLSLYTRLSERPVLAFFHT